MNSRWNCILVCKLTRWKKGLQIGIAAFGFARTFSDYMVNMPPLSRNVRLSPVQLEPFTIEIRRIDVKFINSEDGLNSALMNLYGGYALASVGTIPEDLRCDRSAATWQGRVRSTRPNDIELSRYWDSLDEHLFEDVVSGSCRVAIFTSERTI